MTIRVSRFDNGLTVATDPMSGVETVSLGAWVGVGTRNEPAELNGISHLLEHMLFKGTGRRSARDIAEEIEAVGGQMNAYTGRESTAFYAKVLSENLDLALDVIADLLQNSRFDEEELGRERSVVIQEIGQVADTPDDVIFDHFQEIAFPGQALGRPVLGTADSVAGIGRDSIRDYLGSQYGAPRVVVVAAGDVEHESFAESVARLFAAIPREPLDSRETARYQGGEYRESRDLEQIHLVLGFESVGYCDPGYYPSLVLSTLFGGGMSSRLFQEIREERGLAYSIYSFVSAYADGGLFGIYAGTGSSQVEELVPLVCEQLCRIEDSLSEEEVSRARAQLRASTLMARESSGSRAEQLGQQILAYGAPRSVAEILAEIEAVDVATVVRLAKRLRAGRPTLASVGPLGHLEPYERLAARLG
jgi:predicted Zn-dependent peptidase